MSFGATLRVLRLQSGLGLRDLARRLGVSSTYLSRIENDIDPAPTPARLATIARELGISATTLIEIARRISPLLSDYIERVPEAGPLFADLALRQLTASELAEVQRFVERKFPRRTGSGTAEQPTLASLLTAEHVVLGLRCTRLEDALQIAAGRLAATTRQDGALLGATLMARESDIASGVGNGVAVVSVALTDVEHAASLITFAPPLVHPTPDKRPLRVLIVFIAPKGHARFVQQVAEAAQLAARGLGDALCDSATVPELLSTIERLQGGRNS